MADDLQYVDIQLVVDELPGGYSVNDLPDEAILQYILEEGRDVDTRLGPTYCTFNAYDHTLYPTPKRIQEIVRDGALAKGFMRLGMGDRTSAFGSLAKDRADNAMRMKQALAGHDQVRTDSGAGQVVESELAMLVEKVDLHNLTWGTGVGAWDLPTNEAYVSVESFLTSDDIPTIMVPSIRVSSGTYTGYRFADRPGDGIDAICYFDGARQRWVLRDLSGYISSAAPTVDISYRWEWRRATWRPTPYEEDDEVVFGGAV